MIGFSAYPVHFRGEFTPCSSISQALEQFYVARAEGPVAVGGGYATLRSRVEEQLRRARRRVDRRLEAVAGDEPEPGEVEQLRTQAGWLLALNSQIRPGQQTLEVDLSQGTAEGEAEVLRIPLDRDKKPVEQAQQMFKHAAKLARAAEIIPRRRAQLEADLAFLDQLETDLALAENQPGIAAVVAELRAADLLPSRSQRQRSPKPAREAGQILRYASPAGFEVLVGRNARQNERVTFTLAQAQDHWLHVRDVPGAHVVVRSNGRPLDEATLHMAAQLAAYYSKARGERSAAVAVTQRRFVSRIPGGRPGQVRIRRAETVIVPAELPPPTT